MNEGGNHGGDDPGESEATLLFASPKFRTISPVERYECPTVPRKGTKYHFYNKVHQQDIVPTIAGLMDLPIPRNSIGKFFGELRGLWRDDETYVRLLQRNARQMRIVVETVLGQAKSHAREQAWYEQIRTGETQLTSCLAVKDTTDELACLLVIAEQHVERSKLPKQWAAEEVAFNQFLTLAKQTLIEESH